ncbi:ubiquitin-conjugating enzyme E2 variant 3 isoform X3, partial [Silurus meridionalis]
ENVVVIQETFTPVIPSVQPAKKIILSNVPPFIKDELITELSRYGKIVSRMRKVLLGCKSPSLKHVVSFRTQVFMIPKGQVEDLSVAFTFRIDGFDYVVCVSSETMRCFKCGEEEHIRSLCRVQTADNSA